MLSVSEISAAFRTQKLSPLRVLETCTEAYRAKNESVKAFCAFGDDHNLKASALGSGKRWKCGSQRSTLDGLPIAIKDNIAARAFPMTCGSNMLQGHAVSDDAVCVERLRSGGALMVGKTNLDEFAMGAFNTTGVYGAVRNPRDTSLVAGGSSGGSAAAIAAGICPVALGSDTGGSVRVPASFCRIVGFKPTYGTIPRTGLTAYASSLDVVGILSNSAEDASLVYKVIQGRDPRDPTSIDPLPLQHQAGEHNAQTVIGIPRESFIKELSPEARETWRKGAEILQSSGCRLVPVEIPHMHYALPTYKIIATGEACSNLAKYRNVQEDGDIPTPVDMQRYAHEARTRLFGAEVKRRLVLGTYVLSAGEYDKLFKKAQQVRTALINDFRRVFESVDAVVTPTTLQAAPRLGSMTLAEDYLADVLTVGASLAGLPALSVPVPRCSVGLQLVGPFRQDFRLLDIAQGFEKAATAEE